MIISKRLNLGICDRIGIALLSALISMFTVLVSLSTASAAPGTLAQTPLFLGIQAPPNILFLIDDSGSMDWEIMTTDADNDGLFTGTQRDGTSPSGSGSVKHRDSDDDGTANCDFDDGDFTGYLYGVEFGSNTYDDDGDDCNTADDQAWRFRNHDFNPLYFNPDPDVEYPPWVGLDANGNPFGDISITSAPNDPYNPTETIDLTTHNSDWDGGTSRLTSDRDGDSQPDGFRYYTWDGDLESEDAERRRFDDGEETEHLIKNASPEMQQKFANWFSYYRKREYVAKAAYGQVIAKTNNVRIGLVTIHNHDSVNTAIAFMNEDPTTGAKKALLDALYSIDSDSNTPLRSVFNRSGEYLECSNNDDGDLFRGSCPALSLADGGQCQQNFNVVMTDGFYNGSFSGISNSSTNNNDGDDSTSFDGGAYADSFSNTLADIAMRYYEDDLHDDLPNVLIPKSGVDPATHQHMTTYSVAFGVNGTITDDPPNNVDPFTWPNPATTPRAHVIDDLRHAAYNGRGDYLSAQDPEALVEALDTVITSIANRSGTAAAVSFNASRLDNDSVAFVSVFNTVRWSGTLQKFMLNAGGGLGTELWDAANEMDDLAPADGTAPPRTIFTSNGTDGTRFHWDDLTLDQKLDLCIGPETDGCYEDNGAIGGTTDTAVNRLKYLRGERINEIDADGVGDFRPRVDTNILGDFIHSSAVFVGPPQPRWPDIAPFPTTAGQRYSDFLANNTVNNRTPIVYVGGNDGMLHGFNANTGVEELAYIPNNLFSTENNAGLHYLTNPEYNHRYYVDLTPSVANAYVKTTSAGSAAWHTVLVGGERAGGRGLFALDITDPSQFVETAGNAASIVMWEFTSEDDADLGFVFGTPTIALLNNGRWAAIFGNGYNHTGSGEAQLFIVYLDGGLDGTWTADTDYVKLTTGVGSINDPLDPAGENGLSKPSVADLDSNGTADRVYAGDLRGNVWVFDLSADTSNSWSSAYTDQGSAKPLFTAANADDQSQPITGGTVTIKHPTVEDDLANTPPNNFPNVLVMFGTGQLLVTGDPVNDEAQSFYGVWDDGSVGSGSTLTRDDLVAQGFVSGLGDDVRVLEDNFACYSPDEFDNCSTKQFGWYVDLPANSRERVIDRAFPRGNVVFFSTVIPSEEVCQGTGSGWLMALSTENGGRPDLPTFDVNDDNIVDEGDFLDHPTDATLADLAVGGTVFPGTPTATTILDNTLYTSCPDCDEDIKDEEIENLPTGRLSWEELLQ